MGGGEERGGGWGDSEMGEGRGLTVEMGEREETRKEREERRRESGCGRGPFHRGAGRPRRPRDTQGCGDGSSEARGVVVSVYLLCLRLVDVD